MEGWKKSLVLFFLRREKELYYRSSLSRVIVLVHEIFLQLYKFPYRIPFDRDFIGFKSGEFSASLRKHFDSSRFSVLSPSERSKSRVRENGEVTSRKLNSHFWCTGPRRKCAAFLDVSIPFSQILQPRHFIDLWSGTILVNYIRFSPHGLRETH